MAIKNHVHLPLSPTDAQVSRYVPEGGCWRDVPYERLPQRLKRIRDHNIPFNSNYQKARMDGPAGTISATMSPTRCQALAPDERYWENLDN